jgi:hypothetical protein
MGKKARRSVVCPRQQSSQSSASGRQTIESTVPGSRPLSLVTPHRVSTLSRPGPLARWMRAAGFARSLARVVEGRVGMIAAARLHVAQESALVDSCVHAALKHAA